MLLYLKKVENRIKINNKYLFSCKKEFLNEFRNSFLLNSQFSKNCQFLYYNVKYKYANYFLNRISAKCSPLLLLEMVTRLTKFFITLSHICRSILKITWRICGREIFRFTEELLMDASSIYYRLGEFSSERVIGPFFFENDFCHWRTW